MIIPYVKTNEKFEIKLCILNSHFFRLNKYESSIFFLKLIFNRKKYILYFYIYNNFTRISKLKVSIIILNCMQEN